MKVTYNPTENIFVKSNTDVILPQIMWHVTDTCLLNCKTCFSKGRCKTSKSLNSEQVLNNLVCLKELQVQKIDISGGEPLLSKQLQYIVAQSKLNGFYLTITTRGVGLSENIIWLVNNWNMFSRIILSLDNYDEKTYDNFVEYNGAYKKLESLLSNLSMQTCNNIRINTVVNKDIIDDVNIKKMCSLIGKLSPLEWCIIQPHPLNKREQYDEYAVTENEYLHFIDRVNLFFENNVGPKILVRPNYIYSTYWCLYSDNTIARLSNDNYYSFSCELTSENINKIIQTIKESTHRLPN